jgi:hypothetical protein
MKFKQINEREIMRDDYHDFFTEAFGDYGHNKKKANKISIELIELWKKEVGKL